MLLNKPMKAHRLSTILLLTIVGCSEVESASPHDCSNNNDGQCPEGEFCDRDTCRVPFVAGNLGNECALNTGHGVCSSGLLCIEGLCRSCASNDECNPTFGEICMTHEGYEGHFCGNPGNEPPSPPPTAPVPPPAPDPVGRQ